jgi:hypothetical protein
VLVGASDLSDQDYGDISRWKLVVVEPTAPAQVVAEIKDSSVHADSGILKVHSEAAASIDAIVVAVSVALAGGAGAGVAVSAGGVYVSNEIDIAVKSLIDGDGNTGITAGSVVLEATDSSGINAIAGAASIAGAITGTGGAVAVSIGLALAFNEVGNQVEASIVDADQGVNAKTGSVTISALAQGKPLITPFDLSDAGLTKEMLDDATLADVNVEGGGNEATQDAIADTDILATLRTALAAHGLGLPMQTNVATAAMFKTDVKNDDGNHFQNLDEGNTVQVGAGYDSGRGEAGRVYRYIGAAQTHVDLAAENYTDTTRWLKTESLKLTQLVAGHTWSLLAPNGKAYVLTLDGDTLSVAASTINAVSVAASVAVSVGGEGVGVAVSGAGAVSQNIVTSQALAYAQDSVLSSAHDVTLSATSASDITAIVVAVACRSARGRPLASVRRSASRSRATSSARRTARPTRSRCTRSCRTPACSPPATCAWAHSRTRRSARS